MNDNRDVDVPNLVHLMEKRSRDVLQVFRERVVSSVTNAELLQILEDVSSYRGDIVRTTLLSCSCEVVGGRKEVIHDLAVMFALFSAAIGIHDDIIDKSDKKHFSRTIFGRHGMEKALLVGDLLLVKAWAGIGEMLRKGYDYTIVADAVEAYHEASVRLCEAELAGISCKKRVNTDLRLYRKVLWKINADIESCAKIGAILGGGSKKQIRVLSNYGRRLGFMFGIADDFRDCLNAEGNLLSRLEHESIPLPLLYAAKSSKKRRRKIEKVLEKPMFTISDAETILEICAEAKTFTPILEMAKLNMRKAIQELNCFGTSNARDILVWIFKQTYLDVVNLCDTIKKWKS